MDQTLDLRDFLDEWIYDPKNNVRLALAPNGRKIVLVRQPMGLEQYEIEGRPDGQRPRGKQSLLDFHETRLAARKRNEVDFPFQLTAPECEALFEEGLIYYRRLVNFFRLKDWLHAERDTARNLRLLNFVNRYAEQEEDRVQIEPWRPMLRPLFGIVRVMIALDQKDHNEALRIARNELEGIADADERINNPPELARTLLRKLKGLLAISPALRLKEECRFQRQGDYWTLVYHGQTAHLRASRGLQYLVWLLGHPGKECHVSELLRRFAEPMVVTTADWPSAEVKQAAHSRDGCAILDRQAKAEYKHRLEELREDLEEAERSNDPQRAGGAQEEMSLIAQQIVSAVGLGGRDRRMGSDTERARSAITKRIKESITRIGAVYPSLGQHLATRIKTGYFCSYDPHPDRPVVWKF